MYSYLNSSFSKRTVRIWFLPSQIEYDYYVIENCAYLRTLFCCITHETIALVYASSVYLHLNMLVGIAFKVCIILFPLVELDPFRILFNSGWFIRGFHIIVYYCLGNTKINNQEYPIRCARSTPYKMEWPFNNSFEVDANNCSVVRELSLLKCAVTLWSLDRLFNAPSYLYSWYDFHLGYFVLIVLVILSIKIVYHQVTLT